jgi:hypothetical protein
MATAVPTNRLRSIDEIALGDVVWAYARGAWRKAVVLAKARTRLTVMYVVRDDRLRYSVLGPAALRRESPGRGPVVTTPAPPLPENAQDLARGVARISRGLLP